MFELKLNNNTIKLKWGTWSMRRFTEKNGVTIDKYFEVLGKAGNDISILIQLIHIGYETACTYNKEEIIYTDNDVCDWIDEVGGIFKESGQIVDFIKYIVSVTIVQVNGIESVEKKKSNKAKLG